MSQRLEKSHDRTLSRKTQSRMIDQRTQHTHTPHTHAQAIVIICDNNEPMPCGISTKVRSPCHERLIRLISDELRIQSFACTHPTCPEQPRPLVSLVSLSHAGDSLASFGSSDGEKKAEDQGRISFQLHGMPALRGFRLLAASQS